MREKPYLLILTTLIVALACGTAAPNLEATGVAQDKATMEALATLVAEKQQASPETDTPMPTPTSIVVIVTATPEAAPSLAPPTLTPMPTDTPIPPTSTPLPTPTLPSDTPPGTVLSVGETWITRGFKARLDRVEFEYGNIAELYFTLMNTTGRTLFFYFNPKEHVTMQDDLGRFFTWRHPYDNDIILENGDSSTFQIFKGEDFSGSSYFIITLNIPDLIYAQWRYN